jgi:hypothetical protein
MATLDALVREVSLPLPRRLAALDPECEVVQFSSLPSPHDRRRAGPAQRRPRTAAGG